MGNQISLTKPVFEWLIEQLVFIEEASGELAGFIYPDLPIEQEKMKVFFQAYVEKIESVLKKVNIVESIREYLYIDRLNEFPFIIIGSQVTMTKLSDNSELTYVIVFPVDDSNNQQNNELSCISPLGKELLLKEVKSEFDIIIPEGLTRVRIDCIKLNTVNKLN